MLIKPQYIPNIVSFMQRYWAPILTVAIAVFAGWVAIYYANQPILERHGFRQTQTALTSYWMIHEGWQLAYQTPVAGYPWSIPFEFPIYQTLAALIAWLFDFQLDPVGRLLSFGFLLACAWPSFRIVRKLGLPSEVAWVFCALLWSSPLYIFWGRTFMIETAALFFTLAALSYLFDLSGPTPCWRSALFFAFWGTLAMLQKVTTAAPTFLVMGGVILAINFKSTGLRIPSIRQILCFALAFAPPIMIALLWNSYADSIKSQNLFGSSLTSSALFNWNFGSIEQRLNAELLKSIFWDRALTNNAAGFAGVFLVAGAIAFGKRHVKVIVAVSLVLFVVPIMIFTNLHYVHDYYQCASAVFLIFALAAAVALWLPQLSGQYAVAPVVVIILIISNIYHFEADYAHAVRMPIDVLKSNTLAVGHVIKNHTPENSAIVVFGNDWNSDIAYYSQRKSFTVQKAFKAYDKVWNHPGAFIGDLDLGALVFCEYGDKLDIDRIMESPLVKEYPKLYKVGQCYLWLPKAEPVILPEG